MQEGEFKKGLDEIIILGTGRSCCHCPTEHREGVEIWGCPFTVKWGYVDRVFQIHKKFSDKNIEKDFIVSANNNPSARVYTAVEEPQLVNSTVFPIDEVMEEFNMKFFLNTLCYMIALAIMQKPKKIQCYGVDMRNKMEYITEKGCVEFWLGVALGRGIKVATTTCSNVLGTVDPNRSSMYGYE